MSAQPACLRCGCTQLIVGVGRAKNGPMVVDVCANCNNWTLASLGSDQAAAMIATRVLPIPVEEAAQ